MDSFALFLELLVDHDRIVESTLKEISGLYMKLCTHRALIDRGDTNDQRDAEDYQWEFDRLTSIIDQVVGAYLVIAQGEVARVAALVCGHLNPPCEAPEVRSLTSSRFNGRARIEVIWMLCNYFKHQDEWPPYEGELTDPRHKRIREVLVEIGLGSPVQAQSGFLERAVRDAFGCSEWLGLDPILQHVEEWKAELGGKLREDFHP